MFPSVRRGVAFSTVMAAAFVSMSLLAGAWQGPGQGPGQGQPPQGQGPGPRGGGGGGGSARGGGAQGRGQGPARDALTQAPATGTGAISGAVTLQGSGTAIRRATVTLSGTELRGVRTVSTNDQGAFSFAALPAGRFTLTVSKPGYVGIAYGAKKPGRQGTPIQLAEGQKIDNANITLPRGSVITGVVIDEHGEPSPNTQVRAFRYVSRNGEPALQNAGQDQTDDRGMYRIFQLQPGDYMVSASPRNQLISDVRQQIESQLQPLLQQLQSAGAAAGRAGAAAAGAQANTPGVGNRLNNLLQGGTGDRLLERVQQLQSQLQQQPDEQSLAYAPVYYPGTTAPASASKVTLGIGEERGGIDFQLQLVPTAKVQGVVSGVDGTQSQPAQISLQPAGRQDAPVVPGVGANTARVNQDGKFSFQSVTPGQYTLMVRAAVPDPNAVQDPQGAAGGRGGRGAAFGLGGRGGRGNGQVLWASADINVDGHDMADLTLVLQPGMTIAGRIAFDASTGQPPSDLTGTRVTLQPTGQSTLEVGPMPGAQADTSGQFTITGVPPGQYSLRANLNAAGRGGQGAGPGQQPSGPPVGTAAAAQNAAGRGTWTLKSVTVNGRDTLDFPLDIRPSENISGALLTFTDRTQELSGTLQDATGKPTADYTVIVFSADNHYWTPQSRRIVATRPGTDGTFTFRNLPAGQYRLTAVTDAEQGEWFDPSFLSQLIGASISFTIADGEKKVQDIRLAGG